MRGGNPLIQFAAYLVAGFPQPQNPPAVDQLSTVVRRMVRRPHRCRRQPRAWIDDRSPPRRAPHGVDSDRSRATSDRAHRCAHIRTPAWSSPPSRGRSGRNHRPPGLAPVFADRDRHRRALGLQHGDASGLGRVDRDSGQSTCGPRAGRHRGNANIVKFAICEAPPLVAAEAQHRARAIRMFRSRHAAGDIAYRDDAMPGAHRQSPAKLRPLRRSPRIDRAEAAPAVGRRGDIGLRAALAGLRADLRQSTAGLGVDVPLLSSI